MNVQIAPSWKKVLASEFEQPYFKGIVDFLKAEKELKRTIYPAGPLIFNAFEQTPFEKVKVVILGQDPYHGPGQAHGLAFSVNKGIALPPSLKNIFKELATDIGLKTPTHGDLTHWAQQGVLLLNATLTVRAAEANSHAKIGWMEFTDAVIAKIAAVHTGVVFILWGRFAQQKEVLINPTRHHILKSAHPSPLSAHNGFFGCKHFSKTNELLVGQKKDPIDWSLDS
ncbi:Uracil-DNA glycosylase [Arachidicoccus rhizosphaerae]|jgi:uracil-DNA glycosylase|uniref:Uracil-DNA glycosylase n=1 Tax=Arachidicoccus rhizosphaerae TaxID=551991 RepID=A0A1H4CJU4_9BACT|nr:uracil-DNA glycosylase [Arachidicoccus rhizosphaerae]SEA60599.1 Uracil-DNA glycosylase [Arachidicoccus rhizosphaerae]